MLLKKEWSNIKTYFIRGLIITIISIPFSVVVILKAIYHLKDVIPFLSHFSVLVTKLFNNSGFIRFIWEYLTPSINYSKFTFGDLFAIIIFLITLVGIILIGKANNMHNDHLDAKQKAREQQLINEYKG